MKKIVIYNHGKDSVPWSEKSLALAEVAKRYGYEVASPDYRQQLNPEQRLAQLLAMDWSAYDEIILAGSSMGGYVATLAAPVLNARALFLLAPAFYLPNYQHNEFNPPASRTQVIHGWQDDIVPPEHAWRFCQQYRAALTLLDADHRLMTVLATVVWEFERFLLAHAQP